MAKIIEMYGFCKDCNRRTKIYGKKVGVGSHFLHLVLSLFTFGLWLIVWFCVSASHVHIGSSGFKCTECGGSKVKKDL